MGIVFFSVVIRPKQHCVCVREMCVSTECTQICVLRTRVRVYVEEKEREREKTS